ncbi:MAG TPA: Fic family protein, partial [Verrucomicrobiae bacterium]|nr:Fic family protein [Verrucomicrobiae bacterium]
HIFGSLIRIHPFEDGNGRTARLFAFYALRCWGLPLFPIPKIRNDRKWKLALGCAVGGDALKLMRELYWRMDEAIHLSVGKAKFGSQA